MIRFSTFTASLATLALASVANAQLLQFNTVGNTGSETTEPSVANDLNVLPSTLTLGAGITSAANTNRFGGSGFFDTGDTVAGTTLSESIAGNDFFEFTLTPVSGFQANITGFSFIFDRSSTGPNSVALRSSVDNFASDRGQVTGLVSGGAATTTVNDIPITGLTGLTGTTTFRLFGFGGTATGGTGGFDTATAALTPNVILNGSTSAVPEPAALGLLSLGGLLALRRRR
jgi:hypothetical protein